MRRDKTEWAISRLRSMPELLLYRSVLILASNSRTVSYVARHLLGERDRGGLQVVTFHTLRTYLTPVHKIFSRWRASGFYGSVPALLQEANNWFEKQQPTG